MPKPAPNNDKVIKYLTGRGIDIDIIKECIDNRFIYQQADNNNVVFVDMTGKPGPSEHYDCEPASDCRLQPFRRTVPEKIEKTHSSRSGTVRPGAGQLPLPEEE